MQLFVGDPLRMKAHIRLNVTVGGPRVYLNSQLIDMVYI